MPREVELNPGWLRQDTRRATERIQEWSFARDERSPMSVSQDARHIDVTAPDVKPTK